MATLHGLSWAGREEVEKHGDGEEWRSRHTSYPSILIRSYLLWFFTGVKDAVTGLNESIRSCRLFHVS